MEEYANLLWVGYILANNGPNGFKTLWSLLRPAVVHYLYGFNATEEECHEAEVSLQKYAALQEKMIINKMVWPLNRLEQLIVTSVYM